MDPHLAKLERHIAAALAGLSPEQLARGVPGKWSAAEIIEHLYLTYTGTLKGLGRVLEQEKSLASKATWSDRGKAFIVVNLGYMPQGRKSPKMALPRGTPAEKVLRDVSTTIAEMDALMNRCASKFGARTKLLDHPVLGAFSIDQWRKFHLVHGMHHVKQILRLRQKLESVGD